MANEFDGIDKSTNTERLAGYRVDQSKFSIEDAMREGMAQHDKRMKWQQENPLGSAGNPYIVSPREYETYKALGLCK